MEPTTFTVTGMTCMGCVASVKKMLTAIPGVTAVDVDLASGKAVVQGQAEVETLKQAVRNGGFGVD